MLGRGEVSDRVFKFRPTFLNDVIVEKGNGAIDRRAHVRRTTRVLEGETFISPEKNLAKGESTLMRSFVFSSPFIRRMQVVGTELHGRKGTEPVSSDQVWGQRPG